MKRTRLSDPYAVHLDSHVEYAANKVISCLTVRLAEYLWLYYPDARQVLITTSLVTGRAEPVQILGPDNEPLWQAGGSGWEPGGTDGPLGHLLRQGLVARHEERIHGDIALLGVMLPLGFQWSSPWPERGIRSTRPGVHWEVTLPESTDRLSYVVEEELDAEAIQSEGQEA